MMFVLKSTLCLKNPHCFFLVNPYVSMFKPKIMSQKPSQSTTNSSVGRPPPAWRRPAGRSRLDERRMRAAEPEPVPWKILGYYGTILLSMKIWDYYYYGTMKIWDYSGVLLWDYYYYNENDYCSTIILWDFVNRSTFIYKPDIVII